MYHPTSKVISFFITITLVIGVLPLSMRGDSSPPQSYERQSRGTIVVNASGGGDYTHIQWAIDNASEGDTVYVEGGMYRENVIVNKTINLVGASKENTTIDAGGNEFAVIIVADFVNISGFKMINGSYWNGYGIAIYYSNYSTIKNNICSSNRGAGIYLFASRNNNITDNICILGRYTGISLINSYSNTITKNICTSNNGYGISLSSSYNNIIVNNICDLNAGGIESYRSEGNMISNNQCDLNINFGIYIYSGEDCIISGNNCSNNKYNYYFDDPENLFEIKNNYANSEPVVYLKNASHRVIAEPVSMLMLIDCDNIIVNGISANNNSYGIYVLGGSKNSISFNNLSNNQYGIYLSEVDNNTLTDNICSFNNYGIFLNGLWNNTNNDNTIINNTCNMNYQYGIRLFYSDKNKLEKNICNFNGEYGIELSDSDNNQIFHTICYYNEKNGIYLDNSHRNRIENNNCSNNQGGIGLRASNENTIMNNTCHYNDLADITLEYTNYNMLIENEMVGNGININEYNLKYLITDTIDNSNTVNGMPIAFWTNVTGMRIPPETGQVILVNCTAVIVENQNLCNQIMGITLVNSNNNIISNNTFNSNKNQGIYLRNSDNNIISNNICISNNKEGILIDNSEKNSIHNNTCNYNGEEGLYLTYSNNNKIFNNTFVSNADVGISLSWTSHSNIIHHNILLGNRPEFEREAADDGTGNQWNTSSHGNYWSSLFKPDIDGDGIVDNPYNIGGYASSKDYYPLVKPPVGPLLIADAGFDIIINQHQTVTFNGTGSKGLTLVKKYLWSFPYDDYIIYMHGSSPSYTFHIPGKYLVSLEITDQLGTYTNDSMFVTVLDITPPVANAGKDITAYQYITIYFQGDGSSDNIGITNFTWSFIYDNTNITLDGKFVNFTFIIPGLYRISLMLSDAMGNRGKDIVNVSVIDQTPPDAKAGDDITIDLNVTVHFDGSESRDNVGIITWIWRFDNNGTNITLFGSNPMFVFNESGKYIVYLYVTDEFGNEAMDKLSVTVNEIELEPKEDDDNGDIGTPEDERDDDSSNPLYMLLAILIGFFIVILIALFVLKKIRIDMKDSIEPDEEVRVEPRIRPLKEITLNERWGNKGEKR